MFCLQTLCIFKIKGWNWAARLCVCGFWSFLVAICDYQCHKLNTFSLLSGIISCDFNRATFNSKKSPTSNRVNNDVLFIWIASLFYFLNVFFLKTYWKWSIHGFSVIIQQLILMLERFLKEWLWFNYSSLEFSKE